MTGRPDLHNPLPRASGALFRDVVQSWAARVGRCRPRVGCPNGPDGGGALRDRAGSLAAPASAFRGLDSIVTRTVVATALLRAGRVDAGLAVARAARRDAEPLGAPSTRALTLLAGARAWVAQGPAAADGSGEVRLDEARRLAGSVGSAALVASIDEEQGLQALRTGHPDTAVGMPRDACVYWLGTGNPGPSNKAVEGLVEALEATGRRDAAGRLTRAARDKRLTAPLLARLVAASTTLASRGREP